MRAHLSLAAAILLAGFAHAEPAGFVSADPAYLDELLAEAERRALHTRHEWRVLGHYRGRDAGTWRSQADGDDFFLAPEGPTDPRAELRATLAAFFQAPALPEGEPQHRDQPAACRFPARHRWLDGELRFDPARLPPVGCPELESWKRRLGAVRLTLVFADAYINNPASMFGHTFLRLDKAEGGELLAYTVNFSATPWTTNPFIYPVAGIVGWFPGTYATLPYYIKVREYNALENRDLWEYPLRTSAEELERLLDHLWEIGPIVFRYHYFDENCSYQLLSLLEAMDPSQRLTDRYTAWVFPTETLRTVVRHSGRVEEPVFRPSRYRELVARRAALTMDERALVAALAERLSAAEQARLAALAPDRQAAVLDAAWELQRYRGAEELDEGARAHDQALLVARRRLALPSEPVQVPRPLSPEQGHGGGMAALGGGLDATGPFLRLRLRAAMHDPLASQRAYVPGTRLEMGHLVLEWPEGGAPRLEQLTLFDAASLAPVERWMPRMAWRLRTGWERQPFAEARGDCEGRSCMSYGVGGGPGLAGRVGPLLVYGFAEGAAEIGRGVGGHLRLGPGLAAGALLGPDEGLRLLVEGRARYPLWGRDLLFPGPAAIEALVEGGLSLHLRRNLELRALGRWLPGDPQATLELWASR